MSRIGKLPVNLPAGVEVKVDSNNVVTVKGPKGQLSEPVSKLVKVEIAEGVLTVTRDADTKSSREQHGLARTLINNMVTGVTAGYEKKLQLIASDHDVGTKVEQMNIQEFDDSFALLEKMKNNILLLLSRVQTEEKRRSELEIKAILGKINPHFLYNTLDTLKWYAAGKNDKEMVHFITSLNRLLLYNMSKTTKTTLKSELDAVNAYMGLQKLKYDFDFYMDTGKHPEILQADMPRFVLQPLVENAILHSGSSQGKIWVEVELLASGKITILVKNDGAPIDPEKIKKVLVEKNDLSSNGIGLQYVARMLEARFGEEFELRVEHTGDQINVVEIRIPFEAEEIV